MMLIWRSYIGWSCFKICEIASQLYGIMYNNVAVKFSDFCSFVPLFLHQLLISISPLLTTFFRFSGIHFMVFNILSLSNILVFIARSLLCMSFVFCIHASLSFCM